MSEADKVERRPRVWVLDVNAFDYSPAEAFGEVVQFKSEPFAPGSTGDDWNADTLRVLRKQMLDYVPMTDYLLPTGKPLKIAVLAQLAMERGPSHRWLVWDQKYYRYIEYIIKTATGK